MSGAEVKRDKSVGDTSWFTKAACKGKPTSWFYPPKGDVSLSAQAKAICIYCPVRIDCLEWALRNHEREGIWGGLHPKQRHALAKRRRLNLAFLPRT